MRVLTSLLTFVAITAFVSPSDTTPPASCAARKAGSAPEAFIAIAPGHARDTTVTASVCITLPTASAAKIGSYHGELHFDSALVSAVRVQKPAGGLRVENATIPGRVNFAGAAPTGFPTGAVVNVVLRLRKPGARPTVHLEMLELNATDGADLMKQLKTAAP